MMKFPKWGRIILELPVNLLCDAFVSVRVNWWSVNTVRKNAEALVGARKETGLEVNAENTKYMVMVRNQNTGQNHNMKIDDSSFERVEHFKYLGTTLTDQNSIQEEINSRVKSGNACYHSVQNLLSPSFLSKNVKIKIYMTKYFACCFAWVWNLIAHIEGGT
jgi:hypothetical protein